MNTTEYNTPTYALLLEHKAQLAAYKTQVDRLELKIKDVTQKRDSIAETALKLQAQRDRLHDLLSACLHYAETPGDFTPDDKHDLFNDSAKMLETTTQRSEYETPEIYTESELEAIGDDLAAGLNLRRDTEHRDRWNTGYGSKTNIGLARMMLYNILPRLQAGDKNAAKY
jgi:hypothetical protein